MDHDLKREAHAEFSAWADTYDSHWLNRYLFEPSHSLLLGEIERLQPRRVLDVGCGTGELARRLARRGCHVVALDLCEGMLHRARHKLNGERRRVRFALADSEDLPFADRSFDMVTCANSFHHYPHQRKVIQGMRRVLRPGGTLLVSDGWPDHWIGRIIYDLIITRAEGGSVRHAESCQMRSYFESAGFHQVIQKRTYAKFPILLTRGTVPE